MYKHILVPSDGSEAATAAVEHGIGLARTTGARLTILTVLHPFRTFAFDPEAVAETVHENKRLNDEHVALDNRLEDWIRSSGVTCAHMRAESMHFHEAIEQTAAAQGCDLIVMPAHERYGLLGRSVDSETVKLLSHVRLPVLVMH